MTAVGGGVFPLDVVELPPERNKYESEPTDELKEVSFEAEDKSKWFRVSRSLSPNLRPTLIDCVLRNIDLFAWTPSDMPGIFEDLIMHKLSVHPGSKSIHQKRCKFTPERQQAVKVEVGKLLSARFIQEVSYPEWLANVMMVKKASGSWRICIDVMPRFSKGIWNTTLKLDSLQKLCSSLEPVLRRVVSEELERALAKMGHAKLGSSSRSSPKRLEGPDGKNLQLHFRSRLSLPVFTGGKVEGEEGAAIHVVLLDANTGRVVTSGPESCAKLDVNVLEGDFNNEDDDNWTEEEFESHVVKEREGKRPLLTGELQVALKEGVGTLGELTFTDNSSWIRSRKFRFGLKVASGYCEGYRIREGKTEAFTVKDHRGELYKKHYPPALKDDVWRLEKIGKDGAFHKKLNKSGIYTVEDFLRLVVRDSQQLRSILGSGMSNKMWDVLLEHAKTCVMSGKYYIYYSDETRNIGAIFNNIYEFSGLIATGQYYSAESLNDSQKVFADALVKRAYDNWIHVIEYEGTALLSITQSNKSVQKEPPPAPANYPAAYDQQVSQPHLQVSAIVEPISFDPSIAVGGGTISASYNGNQLNRFSATQHVTPMQFENNSFAATNQFSSSQQSQMTRNDSMGLALGPPQQSLGYNQMGPATQSSTANSYDDWSNPNHHEFLSEEEIRMRSHEMLENEDMQHLLRVFSMGGPSGNLPEDGFSFPSYVPSPYPNFNFDDDRNRPTGKAVVGWLKIKAAMRWGIFVRKKAAERRAQLVELDD